MNDQELARAEDRLRTTQVLLGEVARQRQAPARETFESAADFLGRFGYQAVCAIRTVATRDARIAQLEAELSAMTRDRDMWAARNQALVAKISEPKPRRKA